MRGRSRTIRRQFVALGAAIALTLLVANLIVMLSYNRLVEGRYKKSLG